MNAMQSRQTIEHCEIVGNLFASFGGDTEQNVSKIANIVINMKRQLNINKQHAAVVESLNAVDIPHINHVIRVSQYGM
jgi:hypothetical protein